jgi:hypothetical protein
MSLLHDTRRSIFAAFVIALSVGGCASTPPAQKAPLAATKPPADCGRLHAEIASSEQDKREAAEKQKGAWKAVVPFLVAARYANGKSGVGEADERIEKLQAQLRQQGCLPRVS